MLGNSVSLLSGDSQHHFAKGAFGMRLEFADDVMIDNVEIKRISNLADKVR